jgi:hypothetical protein
MEFKKTFSRHGGFFQFALVVGNTIMLIIFLNHHHLSAEVDLLLNTIGGLSLAYVHLKNLRMKKESN